MHKPNTKQGFLPLLMLSAKNYFHYVKPSFIFIFALVLVKDVGQFLYDGPEAWVSQFIMSAIIGLLLVFFCSCSLLATDYFLLGKSVATVDIIKHIARIFHRIFVALLGFIAIFAAFLTLGEIALRHSYTFGLLIMTLPSLFLFVLFFFTIPNIILHKASIETAFRESAQMVGLQNWLYGFALYAFSLFTWILVSPNTWHEQVLADYYLNFPVDLILLAILLPILNAMIVYSDNELRIR